MRVIEHDILHGKDRHCGVTFNIEVFPERIKQGLLRNFPYIIKNELIY